LALLGAQSGVQGAGQDFDAGFVVGEKAGQERFVEAINAFERVEQREARMEIQHQPDLAERAGELEERDSLGGELR
jgi:hypothetical protein